MSSPLNVGVTPKGAETRAGRVDDNPIESRAQRRIPDVQSKHIRTRRPCVFQRSVQEADSRPAQVRSDQHSAIIHPFHDDERLSTWRSARIQHALARLDIDQLSDELGRFVLGPEQAIACEAGPQRVAGRCDQSAPAPPARTDHDVLGSEICDKLFGRYSAGVGTNGYGCHLVVELGPPLGRIKSVTGEPSLDEPPWMRLRDA